MDIKEMILRAKGRCLLVAEVGINHGGDEDLCWEMMESAFRNGADLVKLQVYRTEELVHRGSEDYERMKKWELSSESVGRLFERARKAGIECMATSFDGRSLWEVDGYGPSAHKIASMDNRNEWWMRKVRGYGRSVMISTGLLDSEGLLWLMGVLKRLGGHWIVMHCISEYPLADREGQLGVIVGLKGYGYDVGFSDHSEGLELSRLSLGMGIRVLEKHFTLDRRLGEELGGDNGISINPDELRELRYIAEYTREVMGSGDRVKTVGECGIEDLSRRGVYARVGIGEGEELEDGKVIFLRPYKEGGIRVEEWGIKRGSKVNKGIELGGVIYEEDLE